LIGEMVGLLWGLIDGWKVGETVGFIVGDTVGSAVGVLVYGFLATQIPSVGVCPTLVALLETPHIIYSIKPCDVVTILASPISIVFPTWGMNDGEMICRTLIHLFTPQFAVNIPYT
jgi:hypothetical protein